ncbi:MAG: Ig-like domain repeat protein, partial [Lachnospiraceae bacterium]|nr:Ig-like domain repeat protein [Lachnospiraceae bacterium]
HNTKVGFTLSGSASDTFGLATGTNAITITNGLTGSAKKTWNVEVTGGTWTKAFVVGSGNSTDENYVADGDYTFTITAKDKVGKETTITRTILVDTTAPTATIDPFSGYSAEKNLSFNGSFSDTNFSSATIRLYNGNTEVTGTGYPKTVSSAGDWTWNVKNLADGVYTLVIHETDIVGNVTDINTADSGTYHNSITVDTTVPTTTLAKTSQSGKKFVIADGTDAPATLTSGTTYYTNGTYSISGSITETNYDSTKVTATKNGTALTSDFSVSGKDWTITGDSSAEGTYVYVVNIEDLAGNTNSYTVTVIYDTTAPTANVTTPDSNLAAANSISGASYQFAGVASDATAGILLERYNITQTEYTSAQIKSNGSATDAESNGWIRATASNGTWSSANQTLITGTTASANANTLHEGKWYVYIYAKDILGHEVTATRTVWIDQAIPTIANVTGVPTYTKDDVVNGTNVTDANGITSVVISDSLEPTISGQTGADDVTVTLDGNGDFSHTFDVDDLNDGTHTFTITATDTAGKIATKNVVVVVDTTAPVPVSTDDTHSTAAALNVPEADDTKGSSFTFAGSSFDATSGIAKIELTITDGIDSTKTKTVTAKGTTNWSAKVNFFEATADSQGKKWSDIFGTQNNPSQGQKQVTIKATDKAGNIATTSATQFVFDTADPTITVNEDTITQFMPEAGLTITGNIADTYKLGTLRLIEKKDGVLTAAATPANTGDPDGKVISTSTATSSDFSIPVPLNSVTPTTGVYTYEFVVTDSVGHTVNSSTYSTTVDLSAPTTTVSAPANNDEKKGVESINETNFRFTGTASDENGVAAVWYKIATEQPAAASVPSLASATETLRATLTDATWTGAGFTKATSTANWNATHTFGTGGTAEGLGYKIYVYAVDRAGNVSTTPTIREFDVDLSYPTITDTSTVTQTRTGFTLSGTASDSFGLKAGTNAVTISNGLTGDDEDHWNVSVNGSEVWTKDFVVGSGNSAADNYIPDGTYTFKFTAEDKAGKKTFITRTVLVDTTAPTVTVESFSGYTSERNLSFNGTFDDVNFQNATIALYKGSDAYTVDGTALTKTVTGTGSWTWNVQNLADGVYTLQITATDKLGNSTTVNTASDTTYDYNITVDHTPPTSTLAKTSQSGKKFVTADGSDATAINSGVTYYTNGTYSISGSITETNYDAAKVTATKNGTALTSSDFSVSDKNWTITGDVSANGTYEYKVRIEDRAHNVTEYTVTVVYDTAAPTASVTSPENDLSGTSSISGTTYSFSGVASDETAGILINRYMLTQTAFTGASDAAIAAAIKTSAKTAANQTTDNTQTGKWITATASNGTWTNPKGLKAGTTAEAGKLHEGKWYVYIYAEDILGHEVTASRTFWVDQAAPAFANVAKDGLTGTKATNSTITISGKVTDANGVTGIVILDEMTGGAADVTIAAADIDDEGHFSHTYAANQLADGTHNFVITATDTAEKEGSTSIQVIADKTAPVPVSASDESATAATLVVPGRDDTKGSSFTFSGNSYDATSGITKIEVTITSGSNSKTVTATGTGSWSSRINYYDATADAQGKKWTDIFGTSASPIQGPKTVTVTATDGAGNTATSTGTFTFDTADPTITVNEA